MNVMGARGEKRRSKVDDPVLCLSDYKAESSRV
jgi:hypothetical protein